MLLLVFLLLKEFGQQGISTWLLVVLVKIFFLLVPYKQLEEIVGTTRTTRMQTVWKNYLLSEVFVLRSSFHKGNIRLEFNGFCRVMQTGREILILKRVERLPVRERLSENRSRFVNDLRVSVRTLCRELREVDRTPGCPGRCPGLTSSAG